MSTITELIRPHWLAGINKVHGHIHGGFPVLIDEQKYQIYDPTGLDFYTLSFADSKPLVEAFAADCNRFSSAAFETVWDLEHNPKFPKATAWAIIKCYYSAFYAAQSLSRILGISSSRITSIQASKISNLAAIFSGLAPSPISAGIYVCQFDAQKQKLHCAKHGQNLGSHEAFWKSFLDRIRVVSSLILSAGMGSLDAQQIASKLIEFCNNLCFSNNTSGNWLSVIRNNVTYQQSYGTWYPFKYTVKSKSVSGRECRSLLNYFKSWRSDSMKIQLASKNDLDRFMATCAFILALCRECTEDLSQRCSSGKSFLMYGPKAYVNFATA